MDDMEYGSRQEAAPESKADVSDGTKELVAAWQKKIIEASTHWQKQFDLMRLCQRMVRGKQWSEQTATDERYVANILQRQVSGRTAAVYARNARFVASPRKRLEFALWDGNEQTLAAANQAFMQAMQSGQPPPPEVAALISDVAAGHQSKQRAQKIGKTLEVLFNYYIKEGQPRFKTAAKQRQVHCPAKIVPNRGLTTETREMFSLPMDVKAKEAKICPIDTPFILPGKLS